MFFQLISSFALWRNRWDLRRGRGGGTLESFHTSWKMRCFIGLPQSLALSLFPTFPSLSFPQELVPIELWTVQSGTPKVALLPGKCHSFLFSSLQLTVVSVPHCFGSLSACLRPVFRPELPMSDEHQRQITILCSVCQISESIIRLRSLLFLTGASLSSLGRNC